MRGTRSSENEANQRLQATPVSPRCYKSEVTGPPCLSSGRCCSRSASRIERFGGRAQEMEGTNQTKLTTLSEALGRVDIFHVRHSARQEPMLLDQRKTGR
jgi:hypothetical protein